MVAVAGIVVVGTLQSGVRVSPWILIAVVVYGAFEALRGVHTASLACTVEATPKGLRYACPRPVSLRPWARLHEQFVTWEDIVDVELHETRSVSKNAPRVSEVDVVVETVDGRVYIETSGLDVSADVLGRRILDAFHARRDVLDSDSA